MGLSGASILEYSPIQQTTQKSKFSTYPMLVQALLNDWNPLECFLPAFGTMGNTLVQGVWSLFQMHIELGPFRTEGNK